MLLTYKLFKSIQISALEDEVIFQLTSVGVNLTQPNLQVYG